MNYESQVPPAVAREAQLRRRLAGQRMARLLEDKEANHDELADARREVWRNEFVALQYDPDELYYSTEE